MSPHNEIEREQESCVGPDTEARYSGASAWTPKLRLALRLFMVGFFLAIAGFMVDLTVSGWPGTIGNLATVLGLMMCIVGGVISLLTYFDE